MSEIQLMHYKQKTPEETVQFLQDILKNMKVEVTETWQERSSIGTYALRLDFRGTKIGANGKGVSKAYDKASAYAEFFERYQNDILGPRVFFGSKFPFLMSPDEKILSSAEIVQNANSFTSLYFSQRGLSGVSDEEKAKAFYDVQKVDYHIYGLEDKYITLPFYSIKEKKVVYLPKSTYTPFYGSNGMCAGNSPEEALVQGLSEIIERVVQRRIFTEKPALPDVPEEYIQQFPYVYEIIQKLKEQEKEGYYYFIKDCSFGGQYPVAALIVYEKNTGKYGIKLGCHPDFGVAIERTLTEATQGQDLAEYSKRSSVDFTNNHVDEWKNIYNSYKFGMGQYPYQLFSKNPTYAFTPVEDVSGMDNWEILHRWIGKITNAGYDVMIRDVSYLGFPSFHIIIPGLSEMVYPSDLQFRATNTRYYVSNILRDCPEKINAKNSKLFISTMEYFLGNAYENTMESYYGVVNPEDVPCEKIYCGCAYFIAMNYVLRGEYSKASEKMDYIMYMADEGISKDLINKSEFSFLQAVKYYVSAMASIDNHEIVMEYLRTLFDEYICNRVDDIFIDQRNVIIKQYPCLTKNSITNREKYSGLYESISQYTYALRTRQMADIIEQSELSKFVD